MNPLHCPSRRRDPSAMTLAEIERELTAFDQTPLAQRTPHMVDRINRLLRAQQQVRYGKLMPWR